MPFIIELLLILVLQQTVTKRVKAGTKNIELAF